MQKLKAFLLTISVLTLFTAMWGIYFVAETVNKQSTNSLSSLIPEEALFSVRVDSKQLLRSTLLALLSNDDETSFVRLQEIAKERKDRDEDLGLNFMDEAVFFILPINESTYTCFSAHIADEKVFLKTKRKLIKEGNGVASDGNVAVIIMKGTSHAHNSEVLTIRASEIIESWKHESNESHADVQMKIHSGIGSKNPLLMPGEFEINVDNDAIRMVGSVDLSQIGGTPSKLKLKENGLLINIPLMSPEVIDSVGSLLDFFDLSNFALTGLSVNYRGLNIEEIPGLKLQPDMDLLLTFSNSTQKDSILNAILTQNGLFERTENGFNYGKATYYIHQVRDNTVYLGRTPFNSNMLEAQSSKQLFLVSGDPSMITTLHGNGMMKKFVELLALYAASKELLNEASRIHLSVKKENNGNATFKGDISFKEKNAHIVLLNYLLQTKLIQ